MMVRTDRKITAAFAVLISCAIGICGCSAPFLGNRPEIKRYETSSEASSEQMETEEPLEWEDAIEMAADYVDDMTLEEKVGQVFIVNLEQLDRTKGDYYELQKCTREMKKTLASYHVGGVILFSRNIVKRKQTRKLLSKLQRASSLPLFTAVDEEGGRVARIGTNQDMGTTSFPSAEEIGKTEDDKYVYEMGKTIGAEIGELGFNVDFAPVADVRTSDLNEEIGDRSFGSDEEKVAQYVSAFVQGLHKTDICATLKHFPGQGASNGDTHRENVDIDSSLARLRKTDFIPFESGIESGADFVMASHISVSKVTETAVPASMSDLIMKTILRDELGFEKIIITDAFDMSSITDHYSPAEAACQSFKAGADIILMPQDFKEAYQGILEAVQGGEIEEEQLDASVCRILAVKIQHGLLAGQETSG